MNERELATRLRGWYEDAGGAHQAAPPELWRRVAAIPSTTPIPLRRSSRRRPLTVLAVAAVLLVGGALAVGSGLVRLIAPVLPSPSLALLATADPSLPASPPPTLSPSPVAAAPSPSLGPGFTWAGAQSITIDGPAGEVATLLADGRVLVIQACGTQAELYDPRADTFSATGSMGVPRFGFTATRLADGRVLVTGGVPCGIGAQDGLWRSAELYDPLTGAFSDTGWMEVPREFHTATLLQDGRVLIVGGLTSTEVAGLAAVTLASVRTVTSGLQVATCSIESSAELYDPASGHFTTTGSMSIDRASHTATLLDDGRVLVVGGGSCRGGAERTTEMYSPTAGTFSRTGSLATGRWRHTATLLDDGRVLIAGGVTDGRSGNVTVRSAEMYDPRARTFSAAGMLTEARQGQAAILLPDGRVFIVGGIQADAMDAQALASTEMFNPPDGTFAESGSMGVPRDGPSVVLLDGGLVLIVGGADTGPGGEIGVASAVLYRP